MDSFRKVLEIILMKHKSDSLKRAMLKGFWMSLKNFHELVKVGARKASQIAGKFHDVV